MTGVLVPTRCQHTAEGFAIEFEERGDDWVAVEAHEGNEAGGGGDDAMRRISGGFLAAPGYGGCPSCGQTSFFHCWGCDGLSCWDGRTEEVTCPWCGDEIVIEGDIEDLDAVDDANDAGVDRGPPGLGRR